MIARIKNIVSHIAHHFLIENNEWYQSQFRYCDKFWKGFPFNLEVVNLGSNTGLFGFRYEKTALRAANWALSPQSFNQDLAILKTYESYIGPRGTILVPLGPYSSCLKRYTDTEWMKYFTILHPGVNERFSEEKQEEVYRLTDRPFRVAPKEMTKGLVMTALHRLRWIKAPLAYDYCPMSESQLENNAMSFVNGWMKQFKIEDMDAPLPVHIREGRKQRVETLREMIRFCDERDFRMFVVLPPVTSQLSSKFTETFRENYMYSFLREAGLTEDRFLNYLEDEELQKPENFYNSLFLNKKGGELFTQKVLTQIGLL